jgi:hypothetical protein
VAGAGDGFSDRLGDIAGAGLVREAVCAEGVDVRPERVATGGELPGVSATAGVQAFGM